MFRRTAAAATAATPSGSPLRQRTTAAPPSTPNSLYQAPLFKQEQRSLAKEASSSNSNRFGWYLLAINLLVCMATLAMWMEYTSARTTSSSTKQASSILQKTLVDSSSHKRTTTTTFKHELVVTEFSEHCYMMLDASSEGGEKLKKNGKMKKRTKQEDPHHHRHLAEEEGEEGIGKSDKHYLGRCVADYPQRVPPKNGYLQDIDYFHHRTTHDWREACYLYCLNQLPPEYWTTDMAVDNVVSSPSSNQAVLLNQAVVMGLPRVVDVLKNQYSMDPLQTIEKSGAVLKESTANSYELDGSNALQQAVRMGNAEILAILCDWNIDLIMDEQGRTVKDYIEMKGSPIRPRDAKNYLNVDTTAAQNSEGVRRIETKLLQQQQSPPAEDDKFFFKILEKHPGMGWNEESNWPVSERCDLPIVYGSMSREEFFNDYYLPGRPFVLRGIIPKDEIAAFSRKSWEQSKHYTPDKKFWVGPTAYPSLTGQEECDERMSIAQLEAGEKCPEAPEVPILHAWHPTDEDFKELFPSYEDGDIYNKKSGWRKLSEWFFPDVDELDDELGWQVFFGGDESGATLHWHNAAFNVLYVGIKEWKITPPWYRGFTGMPAMKASGMVDDEIALSCTQKPGDFVYIPNYWGHLTLNHGFTIGAAVIMTNTYQQYADAKPRIHFIHINKAGGSSMIGMLRNRCEPQFYEEEWDENGVDQRAFHTTAHAIIDHYGRDNWENSYNFAIVRHPLARAVSNFFFLIEKCREDIANNRPKKIQKCKDRLIPIADISKKSPEKQIAAFHSYFHKLYETYPPGSPNHYLFGSLGHGSEVFDTFNATQTSWLVDESGEIVVDHIFHLETLSENMDKLAKDIPCLYNEDTSDDDGSEVGRRRLLEMVHQNLSQKYPDYKLFGKNERTNKIMKEVYGVDYKNFGYKF